MPSNDRTRSDRGRGGCVHRTVEIHWNRREKERSEKTETEDAVKRNKEMWWQPTAGGKIKEENRVHGWLGERKVKGKGINSLLYDTILTSVSQGILSYK